MIGGARLAATRLLCKYWLVFEAGDDAGQRLWLSSIIQKFFSHQICASLEGCEDIERVALFAVVLDVELFLQDDADRPIVQARVCNGFFPRAIRCCYSAFFRVRFFDAYHRPQGVEGFELYVTALTKMKASMYLLV